MNIVCVGAHPDDAEFYAGGSMLLWTDQGHKVTAVSLTNGDIGHHGMEPAELAARRAAESREAARRGGYDTLTLGHHDGELMPSLEARKELVRLLRRLQADVVLSHRPCDYHPDHRYTAMLVQDAAFMVTVPRFCPETPALRANPLFLFMMDAFTRPAAIRPDMLVDVDGVMDRKWALLDAMESQFYEWLPWLDRRLGEVPPPEAGAEARRAWLVRHYSPWLAEFTNQHRDDLCRMYGERGGSIHFAEVFEVSEYGRDPDTEELFALCPAE